MGTLPMIRHIVAPLLLCTQLGASLAWAQGDPKATAHEHYERGVAAFDDERFQDAADEFETAYRISPAFAVLYNMGRVYVALGHSVKAVRAFETYLAQGAATIDAARRQEVRAEIEKQRARIGTIEVRTVPAAAEIRVDGQLVGKTPLAQPVLVTAGSHTVEALLSGYAPLVRELDVAGTAQIEIDLRLDPVAQSETAGSPGKPPPAPQDPVPPPPAPPVPVSMPAPVSTPPAVPPVKAAHGSDGESVSNGMRSWGYIVAGVGLLGGAAGGVVALLGVKDANDARDRAASSTAPSASAQYEQARSDFDAAKSQTVLGWTIAGVGAGVLLGGALLVVISPDRRASARIEGLTPWIAGNAGGMGIAGVW
jgi:hypothetical protein